MLSVLLSLLVGSLLLAPTAVGAQGEDPPADPQPEQVQPPEPEQVLKTAQAVMSGEPVAGDRDTTMLLRDLLLARPSMTRAQRTEADRLLARPTEADQDPYVQYPAGTPVRRTCSADVCVHHVTSSTHSATPAWARRTLQVLDTTWRRTVDRRSYPAPARDGQAGGDSRFDVYLADVSAIGFYGYCVPEQLVPGRPRRARAYCVLDNDMRGYSMPPLPSLRVTAAHEFFHAVQFNMDAREDMWFMEASATWMEEQVFDGINDNRQFLDAGQLGRPHVPLDTYSEDLEMYGNWIFLQYVAQRFGPDAVRRIWSRLSAGPGRPNQWSLRGVESYLSSRGVSWAPFYSRFVRANLTPRRSYQEGRAYRPARVRDRHVLRTGQGRHLRQQVDHLASRAVVLRPHRSVRRPATLRVRVDVRKPQASPQVFLLVHRKGRQGSLQVNRPRRVPVALDRRGRGSRTIAFAPANVRRVVLVTSNASLRYRGCGQGTTWACGGVPRDDDQVFNVRVRVDR